MPDLEQAALEDDPIVEPVEVVEELADSAPVIVEEKPVEDGFQKRINKVTADKYAEKRRADDLQRRIDEMAAAKPAAVQTAGPKLEDFDFDEAAFSAAVIDHKVNEAVSKQVATQKESAKNASAKEAQESFNGRIAAFGKDDFDEVASSVPTLPNGVADALVHSENGPELIYHLGEHLDQADKLASMTPNQAMMELGRISATMNKTQNIKPSAAPDPIEPISSGGSISQERGPRGAKFE